ncbi:pyrroline-5-carboxylate reductase [Anaeromassilibacillus senegalensis]|uniref:pyrroline-5-carboxylate reductase n=1 Tax=Anaeromassilibacillus senegalensis TaxID=1673717 RepID=UPI0006804101|nr:pyrroline-5-carboxylate reductase [Anaeromassilibacillus senegalensis]
MDKKIGFIGCGNMGQAMIGGIIRSGLVRPEQVYVSDPSAKNLEIVHNTYGIHITQDNCIPAKMSDILVLSVKPYLYADVIEEIKDTVKPGVVIVMIAAGQTITANEARFGREIKLVRAMPNTPALVGEGMAALCCNSLVGEEEKEEIREIFESFGKAEFVSEAMMDVVAGVSGSSPAYVYMFIEALADGAVLHGMPRQQAYTFAAQAVLGSARMVLETGKHPGELKDMVCSPGGTTIESVASLERDGMRAAVIRAVDVCTKKSNAMSK